MAFEIPRPKKIAMAFEMPRPKKLVPFFMVMVAVAVIAAYVDGAVLLKDFTDPYTQTHPQLQFSQSETLLLNTPELEPIANMERAILVESSITNMEPAMDSSVAGIEPLLQTQHTNTPEPEPIANMEPAIDSSVAGIEPLPQSENANIVEPEPIEVSPQENVLEPIDICFISSIFGPSVETADRPGDFKKYAMSNNTSFKFFLYTNLENLKTRGWTKVIRNFSYRRYITQSRWGKFMAWKDPEMEACQTIFYFDGHFKPDGTEKSFRALAKSIKESEFGLAQKTHKTQGSYSALGEFDKIVRTGKECECLRYVAQGAARLLRQLHTLRQLQFRL
jgi:hypothetical protein